MKKEILPFLLAFLLITSRSCEKKNPGSPELTLFSDTIDWNWELGESYGGNSFYWWHNSDRGVVNLGEMPADCWTEPYDFEHGQYYLRFEILEQPSDQAFFIQLGIWQNTDADGGYSETMSSRFRLENGAGTLLETDLGSPSSWWELNPAKAVNFCKPEDFDRIGLALWKAEPLCLPMAQGWSNSNACEDAEQAALLFFPMKARITIVAVAAGHSFSGWENHP